MNPDEKEARRKYNEIAEHYHNWRTKMNPKGWIYNELLEMPSILKLIGNGKGKKILDFGCGTGIYTKLLTKKGARVKGFDISPKMLKIAKKENPNLDLRVGSGNKIPFDEKFDIVLASLVIEYFNDWDKVFKQINKVLKKGGFFVFSMGNPVSDSTQKVNKNKPLIREFGNYFKEERQYSTWRNILNEKEIKDIQMPEYHKTYETTIKTIIKNGFEIVDYVDCFPLKKAKKLFPRQYNFLSKVPYFCVWKVKKK